MQGDPSDRVIDVFEEYIDHLRHGNQPVVDDLVAAHPDSEEEIRRYFPLLAMIENAAETLHPEETILQQLTPDELPMGEQFGRYVIQQVLGKGGMGTVYLTRDTQLERDVALKIPHFEQSEGTGVTRFYREAKAMAKVHHRNLCPVHDVGDIDGKHFISMAYIKGISLKETIKTENKYSGREAAETIGKLAAALQVAHEAGIIHRDLKPANIMIDRDGEPIIMDFGLARQNAVEESEITEVGSIIGSPAYMAPEQLNSNLESVDHRADIYGLGVILYEMLCGRPPFIGSALSILKGVASEPPPNLRQLQPEVDPLLESICMTAIAKSPDDRFQTAEEFAAKINNWIIPFEKRKKTSSSHTDLSIGKYNNWIAAFLGLVGVAVIAVIFNPPWETSGDINRKSTGLSPNNLTIVKNNPNGAIQPKPSETDSRPKPDPLLFKVSNQNIGDSNSNRVALGDLDGDGDLDAFVSNWDSQRRLWLNDGNGVFIESEQAFGKPGKQSNMPVVIGDIDGDGDNDILAGGLGVNVTLWINEDNDRFKKRFFDDAVLNSRLRYDVALHDLDNDGDLDIFWAIPTQNDEVWLNDGTGNFDTGYKRLDNYHSVSCKVTDLNSDDWPDVVVGCAKSFGAKIWLNNRQGGFIDGGKIAEGAIGGVVALADYNGDQLSDIAITSLTMGAVAYFNRGDAKFEGTHHRLNHHASVHTVAEDFDNDGDMDTLSGNMEGGHSTLFLNDGTGTAGDRQLYPGKNRCQWIATGDLDNDGDIDAFFAKVGPNKVWLNRTIDRKKKPIEDK